MRWQVYFTVLFVGSLSGPSLNAQSEQIVQMDTLNVRDVLYHLGGGGGNGLALIDEINGGVILIDSKLPGWGQVVEEVLAQVTDLPVTTIINSHYHPGHAGSNGEFEEVEQIIAHENTRESMLRTGSYREGASGLPTSTFRDRYTLLDDLDRVELYHFGRAHTDGDIVVVFPEKGVAYLGDLFPDKAVPAVDFEYGGSAKDFPATLAKIVSGIDGVTRVITGHGPFPTTYAGRGRRARGADRPWSGFMTWADLAEYSDFIRELVAEAEEAFGTGQTVGETVAGLTIGDRYVDYDLAAAEAMITVLFRELASQ